MDKMGRVEIRKIAKKQIIFILQRIVRGPILTSIGLYAFLISNSMR
jgi:hypothetical protein